MAGKLGIVKPHNHVVAVQRIHDDFCVKIFSVDARGAGIKRVGNLGKWKRVLAALLVEFDGCVSVSAKAVGAGWLSAMSANSRSAVQHATMQCMRCSGQVLLVTS